MDEGSSCPQAYFDDADNSPHASDVVCHPCSAECSSCNGPTNTDCQSCRNFFVSSSSNGPITQCLTACTETADSSSCLGCHIQCIGCMGPSNQQCVECRYDTVTVDGAQTCVPRCENSQYLARISETGSEHECRTCHDQCLNCTGPGNTACLQCRRANSTVNSTTTCLENCPTNTYESDTGLCQPCNLQCSGGCSGPTNRDCSSCVENTVNIEVGVVECTPFCSFGMVYDSIDNTCQLTL